MPLPSFRSWLLGCVVVWAAAGPVAGAVLVCEPFAGVRWSHRVQTKPRPLNIHVLEIDLTHPGVRFLISPGNGAAPGEVNPQTVRSYVGAVQAQIGINASFFLSSAAGANFDNRGVVASRGEVYSPFDGDARPWPVLNLSADNFAQILSQAVQPSTTTAVSPAVPLYNAVSGSERILTNGRVTAGAVTFGEPTLLHPRTIAGITPDRRLVLATIDGRQSGVSEGFYGSESADLLLQYGCVDAVNLDGGGSTTLVFADPTPRVVNRISDPTERPVGASLAVFAGPSSGAGEVAIFADFYAGDPAGFTLAPAADGGPSQGLLATSEATAVADLQAVQRGWVQRLVLRDDPASAGTSENPQGWFLCHRWHAAAAGSMPRSARGRIGFWLRTTSPGLAASVAVRAPGLVRGRRQPVVADGTWHLHEWDLGAAGAWEAWAGGDGQITASEFTLDSVQLFGANADATVELDLVAHHPSSSLRALVPEHAGRLANVAVRAVVGANNPTVSVGLALAGGAAGDEPLLLRAMGPSLGALGVSGMLADPRLSVYDARRALVGANDRWGGATEVAAAAARLGAFPFAGAASLDSALRLGLGAGLYVSEVSSVGGGAGVVVLEAYPGARRLLNFSARSRAGTGAETLVAGLVVSGGTRRVLVRAVGPGLAAFGLTGTAANPQLAVYAGETLHALNDDWGGGPVLSEVFGRVGAFALPVASRDAALLLTLAPGVYSAHVGGADAGGQVLLEVYEVR